MTRILRAVIHRAGIVVIVFTPLLSAQSVRPAPTAAPVIRFSLYAPLQKNPPVRIIGFEHGGGEVQLVLLNSSDNPVVAVLVGRVDIAPPGCALGHETAYLSVGGAGFKLRIEPHGKGVTARAGIFAAGDAEPDPPAPPRFVRAIVFDARSAEAAYLQVQFGVTGVYFEDGTTWPAHIASGYPPDPFDYQLVRAEADKCAEIATVANALQSVKEVVFDHEGPAVPDKGDGGLPTLRFSCSLEGPRAVCRMPLEDEPHSMHP